MSSPESSLGPSELEPPDLCPSRRPTPTPAPWARSLPSEALGEPQLCYILDAILFLYGIILTLLYCRLKVGGRGLRDPPSLEGRGMGHGHNFC